MAEKCSFCCEWNESLEKLQLDVKKTISACFVFDCDGEVNNDNTAHLKVMGGKKDLEALCVKDLKNMDFRI